MGESQQCGCGKDGEDAEPTASFHQGEYEDGEQGHEEAAASSPVVVAEKDG